MPKSFCASTGKCAASLYRTAVESASRFGTFFANAARGVMDLFGRRAAEDSRPPSTAGEKSPEQVEAVFSNALVQFQNPDPAVRAAALRVFERLGKAESLARATALLDSPDTGLRAQAQEVLRELNPEAGQTPEPEKPQA